MTEAATDIVSQPQDQPTSTLPAGPRRDAGGRWLKGVSGNARGTLEGSRRAFSADFIRTLADDFCLYGRQAIEKVRKHQRTCHLFNKAFLEALAKDFQEGGAQAVARRT